MIRPPMAGAHTCGIVHSAHDVQKKKYKHMKCARIGGENNERQGKSCAQ